MSVDNVIIKALADALPKLKNAFQVLGFIVLVAAVVATRTVAPKAVQATICAGAIGVLFIVFGQVFSSIAAFPESSRVKLILSLFSIFVLFVLALVGVTGYFLIRFQASPQGEQTGAATPVAAPPLHPKSPPLHILLKAYDPRFVSAGEHMNWGGGSQSIFVETRQSILPVSGDGSLPRYLAAAQLAEANNQNLIARVFELGARALVHVDATYDAPRDSDTCIIRQWGLSVQRQPMPSGYVIGYTTGGASGILERFSGTINGLEGSFPLQTWLSAPDEEKGPIPDKLTYLKPGEPLGLLISLEESGAGSHPARFVGAVLIRVYAEISVGGIQSTTFSENAVRAIVTSGFDYSSFEGWSNSPGYNLIEDLRSKAYVGQ